MVGGCMRRIVVLAVVVGGIALAWQYRLPLRAAWVAFRGTEIQSPNQALSPDEGLDAKLASLEDGKVERVALPAEQLQRLIVERSAELLPPYIVAPQVEIRGGRLRLRFQVPTDRFPRVDELSEVLGFLPDTTEVTASGQLIPLGNNRVGVAIDELTAARIPLPRGMIPAVLRRLGRHDEPGLPPDAFAFVLPAGATNAYVRGDSLIFVGRSATRS